MTVRQVALGPEQRSPDHLARQPFGQAPAIEEDGLVLFESGAIALYIAEGSEALMPKDRIGRARAVAWVFSALNSVETAVQQLGSIDFFHDGEAWAKERRPQVEAFIARPPRPCSPTRSATRTISKAASPLET